MGVSRKKIIRVFETFFSIKKFQFLGFKKKTFNSEGVLFIVSDSKPVYMVKRVRISKSCRVSVLRNKSETLGYI